MPSSTQSRTLSTYVSAHAYTYTYTHTYTYAYAYAYAYIYAYTYAYAYACTRICALTDLELVFQLWEVEEEVLGGPLNRGGLAR